MRPYKNMKKKESKRSVQILLVLGVVQAVIAFASWSSKTDRADKLWKAVPVPKGMLLFATSALSCRGSKSQFSLFTVVGDKTAILVVMLSTIKLAIFSAVGDFCLDCTYRVWVQNCHTATSVILGKDFRAKVGGRYPQYLCVNVTRVKHIHKHGVYIHWVVIWFINLSVWISLKDIFFLTNWRQFFMRLSCYWPWISS